MKIPTFDASGKPNGHVITIWNANERPDLRPDQVYLTVVAAHSQKGPHLHNVRRGMFCCIKGNVRLVTRSSDIYFTAQLGELHKYPVAVVSVGVPACLYNDGDEEALVLNMPSPAWSADAPDEWPVEDWNP
jgi:hypothetical protein